MFLSFNIDKATRKQNIEKTILKKRLTFDFKNVKMKWSLKKQRLKNTS